MSCTIVSLFQWNLARHISYVSTLPGITQKTETRDWRAEALMWKPRGVPCRPKLKYLLEDLDCYKDIHMKAYDITKQEHSCRERKPPPTPKFQPEVIRDSNPDFRINADPDVCRICPKMLWMHYLFGFSHFAKYGINRPLIVWEMLTNVQKSHIPEWWIKWKSDQEYTRGSGSPPKAITSEGHPLPMPAKFGRRPFSRSSVILFTEWQNDRTIT